MAKPTEVRAGIDWLTLTVPIDVSVGEIWAQNCAAQLDSVAEQGYDLYTRAMQGYYGVSAGNCFVGEREDGWICQLTGHHANDLYGTVVREYCNVPRVDVQMTIQYDVMPATLGKEAYNNALRANEGLSTRRQRKLVEISGSDGGYTLYIGAPSSEQRGRIYNKEVQSDDPAYERTWRYEIVLRNDLAVQFVSNCPSEPAPRALYCKAFVLNWFDARGIDVYGVKRDTRIVLPIKRTLPTDIEKQLHWLEKQVKPTLKRLLATGYRDIVLERLGLTEQDFRPPE